ncbi:hypothetical protein SAMN02745146_3665 [Hymenobacter daecheongensis DSM 21074]|uniref:SpoIIAA-like n=1 Tax=Hymenobacter daecheongensis DSM 21074 TaxID=1121955 RepID=A0A1M6L8G5_9BACT|nr:hypothetical protein [Hymenobacter daecheongensis]SHJ67463.1 hypothetical protein SAMN02745146_3665 [Hymenobacter daecheongensis DSM 21074]
MLDPTAIEVAHRPDLGLLTMRWLTDPTLAELQQAYSVLLEQAQAQHSGRWLLDVRRRGNPSSEQSAWFTQEWLPRACALLAPLRPRLAYLISPQRMEFLHSDLTIQANLRQALDPSQLWSVRLFTDEGEAVNWLMQ